MRWATILNNEREPIAPKDLWLAKKAICLQITRMAATLGVACLHVKSVP